MYNTYIKKRYPGNRFEYLIFIVYKSENIKINEDRKKDIFYIFKKGNQVINDKKDIDKSLNVGPLFDNNNMPNQWFWSKKSVKITENNTHLSTDHISNIISYITPLPYNASLYCEFDTMKEITYKIFTLGDAKIYKETLSNKDTLLNKETSNKNTKQFINDIPYKNYYICKLPPGKRLCLTADTEFNKPYVYNSEYDIDAQQEIKEIILFDIIDRSNLKLNKEQKFIYTDQSFNKQTITNTYSLMSNNISKFRRPHIIPVLPPFNKNKKLYELMTINEELFINYFKRINEEDNLSFIEENMDDHIVIGFSIIGSSVYCIKFLENAFTNLRRNLSLYSFNDKTFVMNIITQLINKLSHFNN